MKRSISLILILTIMFVSVGTVGAKECVYKYKGEDIKIEK